MDGVGSHPSCNMEHARLAGVARRAAMTFARTILIVAVVSVSTSPVSAQVTALNPTTMTGYAGTAAAHQQARSRAGSASSSRQAQACAKLPTFRKQYGADNSQVVRLTSLCERAGYRVR